MNPLQVEATQKNYVILWDSGPGSEEANFDSGLLLSPWADSSAGEFGPNFRESVTKLDNDQVWRASLVIITSRKVRVSWSALVWVTYLNA